jgi:hypothetical protein
VHRLGSHRYRRAKIHWFRNRYYVAGSQRFLSHLAPDKTDRPERPAKLEAGLSFDVVDLRHNN